MNRDKARRYFRENSFYYADNRDELIQAAMVGYDLAVENLKKEDREKMS